MGHLEGENRSVARSSCPIEVATQSLPTQHQRIRRSFRATTSIVCFVFNFILHPRPRIRSLEVEVLETDTGLHRAVHQELRAGTE